MYWWKNKYDISLYEAMNVKMVEASLVIRSRRQTARQAVMYISKVH
jgi:hypothetical protein